MFTPSRRWLRVAWLTAVMVAALVLVPLSAQAAGKLLLEKGDRVAVVGDSITEQKIYSRFIEDYLTVCVPDLDLSIVQLGWSGETAAGFNRRMNQDLMPLKPDVVTTCYGMNDGRYRAYDDGIGKSYRDPMTAIVGALKQAGVTVLVGSPGVVDSKTWRGDSAVYNQNLARLRDIARDVAQAHGMPFANVHDTMMDVMKKAKAAYGADYHVAGGDGVHPSSNGQLVMAYAFLKGLGLDGNLGTITMDATGKTTATGGHHVISCDGGKAEIQSTRYPFCFFGNDTSPNSTRTILPFLPFNQDLNRLVLVVRNLKAASAKVTWGAASKTFTRDQLATGVNLAGEFPDNPFAEAFRRVDQKVGAKQNFETFLIKQCNHMLAGIGRTLGDDAEAAAAMKTLQARLLARHAQLAADVRKALVPVTHTIAVSTP